MVRRSRAPVLAASLIACGLAGCSSVTPVATNVDTPGMPNAEVALQKSMDETAGELARIGVMQPTAAVVRHGLHGPGPGGAPFLAIMQIENSKYEQLLVNSLGPIELWALSTTPDDAALRNRLYEAVGFQEALRRLSKVFPAGSAQKEVERRRLERLRSGEMEARATESVLEGLAAEVIDGRGVALVLRPHEEEPARRALAAE